MDVRVEVSKCDDMKVTALNGKVAVEQIYLDEEVKEHPRAQLILEKLAGIPFEISDRQRMMDKAKSFTVS